MPEPGGSEGFRIIRPSESAKALTHTPLKDRLGGLLHGARERLRGGGNWQERALQKLSKKNREQLTALRGLIAQSTPEGKRQVWVYGGSGYDPKPTLLSAKDARHVWLDPTYHGGSRFHDEKRTKGPALEEFFARLGARVQLGKSWGEMSADGRQKITVDDQLEIDMNGVDYRDAEATPQEINVLYQNVTSVGPSALGMNNLRRGGLLIFQEGGMAAGYPFPRRWDGIVGHGFEHVADFPVSQIQLGPKYSPSGDPYQNIQFVDTRGDIQIEVYRKIEDTTFTEEQLTELHLSH